MESPVLEKKESRQLRWQKKMKAQGRCITCGKKQCSRSQYYCDRHRQAVGARQNAVNKAKREEQNAQNQP